MLFREDEAVFLLSKKPSLHGTDHQPGVDLSKTLQATDSGTEALGMRLVGAAAAPILTGETRLPGTVNYFLGNDPQKWQTGVPTFERVKYAGVYPGIDLVYYGNQQKLEFDFALAPGADPKPIRLRFEGAIGLKVDRKGDLSIFAPDGTIVLHRPRIYQISNGTTQIAVQGGFQLLPGNTVGFRIGPYDRTKPMVIDPILSYSTFFGEGYINGIAVDAAGEAYIAGAAAILAVPSTPSTIQSTSVTKAGDSAFVAKFNSAGTALIYSTYLGGSGNDAVNAIALDADGNAYVIGRTTSTDFPTTSGAYQPQSKAEFVAKINAAGTALTYSTYFGSSTGDTLDGFAVDTSGKAYFTGYTAATDYPITSGAFQSVNKTSLPNSGTGVVTKMNSAGTALEYSTYLGGSRSAAPASIAVDPSGNAYVVGITVDQDFPTTASAFQLANNSQDGGTAFLTKMNPTGTALAYSTYLGGSVIDQATAVFVDAAGDAYVAGTTRSTDFPTTSGVFQPALKGFDAAFVTKFNPAGTTLQYSTYLGGVTFASDYGQQAVAIAADSSGNALVAGYTGTIDFPLTSGPFQSTNLSAVNSGNGGSFVTKLNNNATSLIYSTYLSGSGNGSGEQCDCVVGLALDGAGDAYVTGVTASNDFPVTAGAFEVSPYAGQVQSIAQGLIFLTKFNASEMTLLPIPTVTVTANTNPQTPDTPVTFTAQVQPATGGSTPRGTVAFSIDESFGIAGYPNMGAWQIVNLDGSGNATYTTSALVNGPNTISAYYLGDANNAPGSDSMTETKSAETASMPVVVTVTPNANPALYGAPVTFTINVKDPSGKGVPSGYVQSSGQFANLDVAGNAVITMNGLAAGADNLSFYYGNFNSNYAPNSASYMENVTPQGVVPAPVLSLPSGTYASAQTLTITDASPDAKIYFTIDGSTPVLGTDANPYNGPITIAQSQTIEAIAVENGYTNSAVTSATYKVLAPTPSINPPGGTYATAQQVTIGDILPAVTIYYTTDGTTPSASSNPYEGPFTVNTSGTVQAIAVPLQPSQYLNSQVASVTYSIIAPVPDFSLTLSSAALSVVGGGSATATVNISPINGFNQTVSFACSGLPVGASCTFSPSTVTAGSPSNATNLTISASSSASSSLPARWPFLPVSSLALTLGWFGMRKRSPRLFPLVFIAVTAGLLSLVACGGGSTGGGKSTTPTPTKSTVTVTATSGSLSHSATLTLTVN